MMHFLDAASVLAFQVTRRSSGVFPDGWGDRESLSLLSAVPDPDTPIPTIDPVWGKKEEHRGYRVIRGHMTSPVADFLPEAARVVPLEMVEPGRGGDRLCVLMPAWNDHGFGRRRRLAVALAERGIGSISFDIPLYGGRRTTADPEQAIRTVADFAVMGFGAIHEARSLLAWAARSTRPGVAGFSMGGNLAALASTTVDFEIAVAPLAASHSPGPVYLDGVLRKAIAWERLGGREVADDVRSVLSSVSVLDRPVLPHHRSAVLLAGTKDGFVPPATTIALAQHWPGSDLIWVEGAGHAVLHLRHRDAMVDAIVRSFDRTFAR